MRRHAPWARRRALFSITGVCLTLIVVWSVVMVLDLHDGTAWNERRGQPSKPRFYLIDSRINSEGFKIVIFLRYVMPMTLLGTTAAVCFLGGLAQPKSSET